MIFFFSGSATIQAGEPECVFGNEANIMLSYHLITTNQQTQHIRFPRIVNSRKAQQKEKKHASQKTTSKKEN